MAGTKLAHSLHKSGTAFVLLEPAGDLGGRIRSFEFCGRIFEEGANWVQGTEVATKRR